MENIGGNQGVDMSPPKPQSRAVRWIVGAMLTLCGILIAVVLLSEPRVVSYVQASADRVAQYFNSFRLGSSDDQGSNDTLVAPAEIIAQPMPASKVEPAQVKVNRPSVRAMPTNRIPVRRAGSSGKN